MHRSIHSTAGRWTRVRLWWAAALLSTVVACGGGGGGTPAGPAPIPAGVLVGQVIKGLSQGTTVSLYSVNDSGQRTFLASAVTNAAGEYRIALALTAGRVYMLEAVGGQYVNEITGSLEALSTPLRGIFVASGTGMRLALSALSESVVLDLERVGGPNDWTANAVGQASSRAASAFGVSSVMERQFVDITTAAPGSAPDLGEDDFVVSFQSGIFAGLWRELALRTPGTTMAQALQAFHAINSATEPDRGLLSAWQAGLIRFVERAPLLDTSRGLIYQAAGLPANARSADFDGIEHSGQSIAPVPDQTFRMLQFPAFGNVPPPGTQTYFDTRGALIAFQSESSGLRHAGSRGIAEVHGDADLAIGRWNKGYEYASGVTRDGASNTFNFDNLLQQAPVGDYVYAAGRTATNLPSCGTVVMSARAQTKAMRAPGGTRTYVIDPASRIAFHHAAGQTRVGYRILIRDDLGATLEWRTPFGADEAPWLGDGMINFQEFSPGGTQTLATDLGLLSLTLHGLLVGDGGTKALLRITGNDGSGVVAAIAAAFGQDGPTRSCDPGNQPAGSVNPVPATGDYYASTLDTVFLSLQPNLQFLGNGTPLFAFYSGVGSSSAVEKAGNDIAGIGMIVPPFSFGTAQTVPRPYVYLKSPPTPVVAGAQSGVLTYRLVASTSQVVNDAQTLITTLPPIASATLTIDLDNFNGAPSQSFGSCYLTIHGQRSSVDVGTFVKSTGICTDPGGGASFFTGAVSGGNHQYAVIRYDYLVLGSSSVALLFERIP